MEYIDLGISNNPKKGYKSTDFNLDKFPYPIKSNSVDSIYLSHILEHLNHPINCLREIERILKIGGMVTIKLPHYSCRNAWMNIEHKRAFSLDTIDSILSGKDTLSKPIPNLFILTKKLNYSCTNYREGYGKRFYEKFLDFLANINVRVFERLCIFWFGGFEEIEIKIIKYENF